MQPKLMPEPEVDAATLAQQATRLGLVSPEQVQDCWDEMGQRGGDAEPFLLFMERKGYLTPWQSSKLIKGDAEGYFLGGYRIEYKIASGSFGRVYRAGEVASGRIVAIKVLRRKWSDDQRNIDLFEREGKLGMSMKHPNVVEILSVNRDLVTKQHYIVMEFVEGGNLRDLLKSRKKLEPAEALRCMDEISAGLSYAFSRGVTHRDMKLTNVLLSSTGIAKLVDFGLADTRHLMLRAQDDTQVDRTVDYAGLEKCTGVPPGDVRSDIYFMGCVLYELLTGRSPLPMNRDAKERMKRERFVNVVPIDKAEVSAPPSLFRLVENMMSLSPELRFQTPSQLLEAIRDVRRDLEGKTTGKAVVSRSLFVVEKDERLQDALRDGFKAQGFRVFLASDPVRALDRYRQQPYDALIIDAGTTGQDGLLLFDKVMSEAKRHQHFCAGILVLSESQRDWVDQVESRECVSLLVRPVTLKQLQQELAELLAMEAREGSEANP
jgi:eukaryotic-like serine/threonine-protein kinase